MIHIQKVGYPLKMWICCDCTSSKYDIEPVEEAGVKQYEWIARLVLSV
jgi:hypothetical protein